MKTSRDIETIKKSFTKTLKMSPSIILTTFLLTALIYLLFNNRFNFVEIFTYSIIFIPILVLSYFLLHVINTKGYDINTP